MSRFITSPDVLTKTTYTVTLVDPSVDDIERVGLYCKSVDDDYDVYLYNGDSSDLQYLNSISNISDQVLINETSLVTIKGAGNVVQYGPNQQLNNPLDYFRAIKG
jgi:hypothetical protein